MVPGVGWEGVKVKTKEDASADIFSLTQSFYKDTGRQKQ